MSGSRPSVVFGPSVEYFTPSAAAAVAARTADASGMLDPRASRVFRLHMLIFFFLFHEIQIRPFHIHLVNFQSQQEHDT